MGSKQRIERHKEFIREQILNAALNIGIKSGWHALSMRKIAEVIEYSAPAIYEYFGSKEEILRELTRNGFILLTKQLQEAKSKFNNPLEQLRAMWKAYWNFSLSEQKRYQIMFGIEFTCCDFKKTLAESERAVSLFQGVIAEILHQNDAREATVQQYYYTFWSTIHGLISINLIRSDVPEEINTQVLSAAMESILDDMLAITASSSDNP